MQSDFSNVALMEMDNAYDYYLTEVSKEVADKFEIETLGAVDYLVKFYEANPLLKDSKRKPRNKNRRFGVVNAWVSVKCRLCKLHTAIDSQGCFDF